MKKFAFVLVTLLTLTMCPLSIFAQSETDFGRHSEKLGAPVEFSVDNGILTLNNISLDGNAVLDISPLHEKTTLYAGTISEFDPINIENGEYFVAIEETSDQSILYYHGILKVNN